MLKIGMIGAGAISDSHMKAFGENELCRLVAISDVNENLAKEKAEKYKIEKVYKDYHDLLNDETIDAVSIATPTFTHKDMVIEALNAGKHVLCEKPPARNAKELREMKDAAEKSGKFLMFAFLARFGNYVKYVKEYIDEGKMGKILYAEAVRVTRCNTRRGWSICKEKSGGGILINGNIHEIDTALYLMGYPKPKAVLALTSDMNKDLPARIHKDGSNGWNFQDTNDYEHDVETFASALVTFENGSCLSIKTSQVLNTVVSGFSVDISGEKAGARMEKFAPGKELRMIEVTDDDRIQEVSPAVEAGDQWAAEIGHFVDCCLNKTECIVKMDEALLLMEIVDAIYQSAETNLPVVF